MTEKLKLTGFLLFVNDVAVSKQFYQKLFDQEIELDIHGINIGFKSGLALWQKNYAQKMIFGENFDSNSSQNTEIYFETANVESMWEKIQQTEAEIIHPLTVQPWQQRVFRIYDPDNFIIEVAETMPDVIKRLSNDGMSIETIVEKTFMPKEIVEGIIK